jgi:hypothetical protein
LTGVRRGRNTESGLIICIFKLSAAHTIKNNFNVNDERYSKYLTRSGKKKNVRKRKNKKK